MLSESSSGCVYVSRNLCMAQKKKKKRNLYIILCDQWNSARFPRPRPPTSSFFLPTPIPLFLSSFCQEKFGLYESDLFTLDSSRVFCKRGLMSKKPLEPPLWIFKVFFFSENWEVVSGHDIQVNGNFKLLKTVKGIKIYAWTCWHVLSCTSVINPCTRKGFNFSLKVNFRKWVVEQCDPRNP